MHRLLLPLLVACAGSDDATTTDTDADAPVDTLPDTGPEPDTDAGWDTGEIDGRPDPDTFVVTDAPLGATPLDGTWGGTFVLRQLNPIGVDPRCEGGLVVTIDGDGARHVVAELGCRRWDPNVGFPLGPYEALTGIGFATLDPAQLDRAFLDLSLSAGRLGRVDFGRVRIDVDGDTLTIDHDDTTGFGALRSGFLLTATARRGASPPHTGDTADTDVVPDTSATAHTGAP